MFDFEKYSWPNLPASFRLEVGARCNNNGSVEITHNGVDIEISKKEAIRLAQFLKETYLED